MQWLITVILGTWEAEIRRTVAKGGGISKIARAKRSGGKALSSNPSTIKKENKKKLHNCTLTAALSWLSILQTAALVTELRPEPTLPYGHHLLLSFLLSPAFS
jgi:hypothetical protein